MFRAQLKGSNVPLGSLQGEDLETLLDAVFERSNELGARSILLTGPNGWQAKIDLSSRSVTISDLTEPGMILTKALAFGVRIGYINSTEPTRRWLAPYTPLTGE